MLCNRRKGNEIPIPGPCLASLLSNLVFFSVKHQDLNQIKGGRGEDDKRQGKQKEKKKETSLIRNIEAKRCIPKR